MLLLRLSAAFLSHQRRFSTRLFSNRIVFLGTPDVAATTLATLHEKETIVGVVTQPPRRRKRKGKLEDSPVGAMAKELGLPLLTPESVKEDEFMQEFTALKPDLCITAAYGQYLPRKFLATPRLGTLNIHPSLLPAYRGASPVQRSLQYGSPTGVSVLYTVQKMDAGPIVAQQAQAFASNESALEVLPALFATGTQLLLDALPSVWDGSMTIDTATPQDENTVSLAPLIDAKKEAPLRPWNMTATECHNQVLGFRAWPQTLLWFQVGSEVLKVKVLETRVVENETMETTTLACNGPTKKSGLYVVCYDGSVLELTTVQPATRKAFPARDLQNGYPNVELHWIEDIADLV